MTQFRHYQNMTDTGERGEITRRVNAKEVETIQQSTNLIAKTKRLSAITGAKNLARRNRELIGPSRARKNTP